MAEVTVVKKVQNAVLRSDGTIRIDNVRLSYPHLAEPYAGEDDDGKAKKPKYGLVALLPKDTHAAAKTLCVEVITNILKEKNKGAGIAATNKFIRNGDDAAKPECEGMYTVNASETNRPSVRDRKGNLLDKEEIEKMFYGGCYGNVLIRPWWQDNKYGKKVNAGLVGVQFLRDGEPFGEGRINDDDAWEDVSDADGDTDLDDDGDL